MQDMVRKQFLPAVQDYCDETADSIITKKEISASIPTGAQEKLLTKLSESYEKISELVDRLGEDTKKAETIADPMEQARFYRDHVVEDMAALRAVMDPTEELIPDELLPYPTYGQMLFYV